MQMAQTITVKLSITPGGIPPVIHLSQYDKTARTLSFLLVDETGTYTVPSGASATIRGTKPDHTGFMYGCTIYGTTVSVAVQDQMTVCAGRVSCELRIAGSDGSILGTANFWLAIEATALADDTIVSKTDLPMVEKAAEAYDATKEAAAAALVSERNAKASETAATNAAKAVTPVSVTESTEDGGSNVVTFGDGTVLTVKNGSKGSKGDTGATGADGKTPVRGTDYWTADDIAAIETYCQNAILSGEW